MHVIPQTAPGIVAQGLTAKYEDTPVLNNVSIDFPAHCVSTIIGPNGSGKTTLLRSLAGLHRTASGQITLAGKNIDQTPRRDLARMLSVLPQAPTAPEGIIVADLVSRGRHPHQTWLRQWSSSDQAEVHRALQLTDSLDLADRPLNSLSGGQRQRVWISMILAQNTDVIFLDEPTTYLDLATSVEILELVKQLRDDMARTIVMVLHDLNLAIRYSDFLVVMSNGQIAAAGAPTAIVTPQLLREAFDLDATLLTDPTTGKPLVIPVPRS